MPAATAAPAPDAVHLAAALHVAPDGTPVLTAKVTAPKSRAVGGRLEVRLPGIADERLRDFGRRVARPVFDVEGWEKTGGEAPAPPGTTWAAYAVPQDGCEHRVFESPPHAAPAKLELPAGSSLTLRARLSGPRQVPATREGWTTRLVLRVGTEVTSVALTPSATGLPKGTAVRVVRDGSAWAGGTTPARPGARVTIRAGRSTVRTVTDRRGRFRVRVRATREAPLFTVASTGGGTVASSTRCVRPG